MKEDRERNTPQKEPRPADQAADDEFDDGPRERRERKGTERGGDSPAPDVEMYRGIHGDRVGG
jgi:hypothetical protein